MLPDFHQHLRRHLGWQWLGISVLSALMTSALIRNSGLGLTELLTGAAAIVLGVAFGVLRDQPGYWIYATLAPKFMMTQRALEEMQSLRFTTWVRLMAPLQRPFAAPCVLAAMLTVILWIGCIWVPEHRAVVLALLLILLFPILLYLHMAGSVLYFTMLAGPAGERMSLDSGMRKRSLRSYRREDLLISLLITYALIWPLRSHPAFSLEGGYANIDFIVAALVLCAIATFFMQLGARRSRVYSQVGEYLSAVFQDEPVALPARFAAVPTMWRGVFHVLGLASWVVLLCLGFAQFSESPAFPLFCLLLLPALGWVYWIERSVTLTADMQKAQQFIEEQAVAPASVERRTLDGR